VNARSIKFYPKCGLKDVFWAQDMPQLWSLWGAENVVTVENLFWKMETSL
jgi:hypothetical protein